MNKINPHLIKIGINNKNKLQEKTNINHNKKSFEEVLHQVNKSNSEIKFSKHAVQRMDNRNINLNKAEVEKLQNALDKAEDKGIKEALILMGNKAFIASVKSKTIITTTYSTTMQDKVFTNIDGAVII